MPESCECERETVSITPPSLLPILYRLLSKLVNFGGEIEIVSYTTKVNRKGVFF